MVRKRWGMNEKEREQEREKDDFCVDDFCVSGLTTWRGVYFNVTISLALRIQLPICLEKNCEDLNSHFCLSCWPQAKFSTNWKIRQETNYNASRKWTEKLKYAQNPEKVFIAYLFQPLYQMRKA